MMRGVAAASRARVRDSMAPSQGSSARSTSELTLSSVTGGRASVLAAPGCLTRERRISRWVSSARSKPYATTTRGRLSG